MTDPISHWINGESSNPEWLEQCRCIWDEGTRTIEGSVKPNDFDFVSNLRPRNEEDEGERETISDK